MKEMKKLGDFIQPVDVRNNDLSVTRLLGLSIDKCFIESIANTIGTDFKPYKIVKKGQFAYGPVTSRNGEKITIALLEEPECIISSSYAVFEITDTSKLLPEYLMLWFSRPEFDRYARYKSHGSVREIFDWDEMCRVELPVPPLNEQQKIVDTYNVITNRIRIKKKINENLEKTAQCLFEEMYSKDDMSIVSLSDVVDVRDGTHDSPNFISEGYPLVTSQNLAPFYIDKINTNKISETDYKKINERSIVETNDILMSMIGTVGNVSLVTDSIVKFAIKNVALIKTSNALIYRNWILCFLKSKSFRSWMNESLNGSTQQYVSLGEIRKITMKIPNKESIALFNEKMDKIFNEIIYGVNEIIELQKLRDLIVSQISKR